MNKRNQVLIGGGIAAVVVLIIVAVVLLRGRNSQATDTAENNGPVPIGAPGLHRPGAPGGPNKMGQAGLKPGGPGMHSGFAGSPGSGMAGHPALPGGTATATGPVNPFGTSPGGLNATDAQLADEANKQAAAKGSKMRVTAGDVAKIRSRLEAAVAQVQTALAPVSHKPKFDPFFIDWKVLPPPTDVFKELEPVRLASEDVEVAPSKPYVVREEPVLRVSGIMSGDGVYAILEGPGGRADIVRPGSQIEITTSQTKRTYRVVSILEDSVKLEAKEGNATYTQLVPLSDTLPAGDNGPGGYVGSGGFPGSGGGRPSGAGGRFGPPKNNE